ncbi:hypothetical protein [Microbacterium sp. NPDC087589]|uniref:hypothetical protein n=1 Tax=Microbacterium sp. NPDC087589 TaxID=3364191 RepID=UPI003808A8B2
MTDVPALWINAGILILTGVMALVAFVQARAAMRGADDAEKARDKAVEAQVASANALAEANRIAGEARDVLRARESRETERHTVKWVPHWDFATGKWLLGNHGPDTALNVRLAVESDAIGRVVLPVEDEVPMDQGIPVLFPHYAGQGGMPRVYYRVDWRSPAGAEHHIGSVWPK